jgi:hypothetical protein
MDAYKEPVRSLSHKVGLGFTEEQATQSSQTIFQIFE